MKNIILILFVLSLLFGCEKKNKIKIIQNYDLEYMLPDKISTLGSIESSTEVILREQILDYLKQIIQSEEGKILIKLDYNLYLNENGKVDLVKIRKCNESSSYYMDSLKVYKLSIDEHKKIINLFADKTVYQKTRNIKSNKIQVRYYFEVLFNGETTNTVSAFYTKNKGKTIFLDKDTFFVAVEQMPTVIGGIKSIQEHIKYPEIAKRAGIEGRVFVKAFIDSTGTVVKTEIIRGIGAGCDEAAMTAVEKVKFKPGMQKGKPVNVQITVPILFKLQ